MSVKATNWAWHESPTEITGNHLLVLMALADIADDDGNCIYGPEHLRRQPALAEKARVSRRTFQRTIADLSDRFGVLEVESSGRANSYRLNLTVRRQSVVLVTPDSIGVRLTPIDSIGVTRGASDAPTVAHHKNVLTKDLNQSSLGLPTEALALRADDEVSSADRVSLLWRARRARSKRALDIEVLNDAVLEVFVDVQGAENARRIVYLIALRILGKAAKAGTDLVDPTRYVITAVRDEPEVWRKIAFGLEVRP